MSNPRGFNQIDKRWVDKYVEMWGIPRDLVRILKLFTGEALPYKKSVQDPRRMLFSEMKEEERDKIINFIEDKKILIVADLLKGRGEFAADWMLVILKADGEKSWTLKSINKAMSVFGDGDVRITDRGSFKIGRILMQRKGGDNGRDTAKMLQFKINPVELFND